MGEMAGCRTMWSRPSGYGPEDGKARLKPLGAKLSDHAGSWVRLELPESPQLTNNPEACIADSAACLCAEAIFWYH